MSTADSPVGDIPVGAPCWVDLSTSDPERSRAFYAALFGWTADEPVEEFGGYVTFRKDGARLAGCMAALPGGVADVWSIYLATDDAQKTADAAQAEGGRGHVPSMRVGDLGTMGLLSDPGGAGVGLWQPAAFGGFEASGTAGTPSWFEVHTRDYDRVVAFYRDVFRWDTHAVSATPEFRYTVLHAGGQWRAGIMDATVLPEQAPAHWAIYFGVDDTDAALARTVELGGSVVMPAEDTPYGRLAGARDATGALFKLVAPNEAMPARG